MRYQTYQGYLKHPMFRLIRQVVMDKAEGRCVHCGAPATEVHHKDGKYPVWGAFDVPAAIEPVCHPCHCRIENKPS